MPHWNTEVQEKNPCEEINNFVRNIKGQRSNGGFLFNMGHREQIPIEVRTLS